jgi:hypothetical protein
MARRVSEPNSAKIEASESFVNLIRLPSKSYKCYLGHKTVTAKIYSTASICSVMQSAQHELVLIVPVLQNKEKEIEELASNLSGSRSKDYEASQDRLGITKEAWFLQKSTKGDYVIVYVEGADVAKSFSELVVSKDPFDLWIKEQVRNLTGVDFNNPPRTELPPKQILRYGY